MNNQEENYDFFTMGIRIAKEERENFARMAGKIEEQYGPDARLEYECGYSITVGKNSMLSMENNFLKIRTISGRNLDIDHNLRNNSYFGTRGVSRRADMNGHYVEPGVIKEEEGRSK